MHTRRICSNKSTFVITDSLNNARAAARRGAAATRRQFKVCLRADKQPLPMIFFTK